MCVICFHSRDNVSADWPLSGLVRRSLQFDHKQSFVATSASSELLGVVTHTVKRINDACLVKDYM